MKPEKTPLSCLPLPVRRSSGIAENPKNYDSVRADSVRLSTQKAHMTIPGTQVGIWVTALIDILLYIGRV